MSDVNKLKEFPSEQFSMLIATDSKLTRLNVLISSFDLKTIENRKIQELENRILIGIISKLFETYINTKGKYKKVRLNFS